MNDDSQRKVSEPPPLVPTTFERFCIWGNRVVDEERSTLPSEQQQKEDIHVHPVISHHHGADKARENKNGEEVVNQHLSSSSWCTADRKEEALPGETLSESPALMIENIHREAPSLCTRAQPVNLHRSSQGQNSHRNFSRYPPSLQPSFVTEKIPQPSSNNRTPSVPPTPHFLTPTPLAKRRHSLVETTQLRMNLESPTKRGTSHNHAPSGGGDATVMEFDSRGLGSGAAGTLVIPFPPIVDGFPQAYTGEWPERPCTLSQNSLSDQNEEQKKKNLAVDISSSGQYSSIAGTGSAIPISDTASDLQSDLGQLLEEGKTSKDRRYAKKIKKSTKQKDVCMNCIQGSKPPEANASRSSEPEVFEGSKKKKKKTKDTPKERIKLKDEIKITESISPPTFPVLHSHQKWDGDLLQNGCKAEKKGLPGGLNDLQEGEGINTLLPPKMKPEKGVIYEVTLSGSQFLNNASFSGAKSIVIEKHVKEECPNTVTEEVEAEEKRKKTREGTSLAILLYGSDTFNSTSVEEIKFPTSMTNGQGGVHKPVATGPTRKNNTNEDLYCTHSGTRQNRAEEKEHLEEVKSPSFAENASYKECEKGKEILIPLRHSSTFTTLNIPVGDCTSSSKNDEKKESPHAARRHARSSHSPPLHCYHPQNCHQHPQFNPSSHLCHGDESLLHCSVDEALESAAGQDEEKPKETVFLSSSPPPQFASPHSLPLSHSPSPSPPSFPVSCLPFRRPQVFAGSTGCSSPKLAHKIISPKGNISDSPVIGGAAKASGVGVKDVPPAPRGVTTVPTSSSLSSSVVSLPHTGEGKRSGHPISLFSSQLKGGNGNHMLPLTVGWGSTPAPPPPPPPLETMPSQDTFTGDVEKKWKALAKAEAIRRKEDQVESNKELFEKEWKGTPDRGEKTQNKKVSDGDILGTLFTATSDRCTPLPATRSVKQRDNLLSSIRSSDCLHSNDNFCCSWEDFSVVSSSFPEKGGGGMVVGVCAEVEEKAEKKKVEEGRNENTKERKKGRKWKKEHDKEKRGRKEREAGRCGNPQDRIPDKTTDQEHHLPSFTLTGNKTTRLARKSMRTPGRGWEKDQRTERGGNLLPAPQPSPPPPPPPELLKECTKPDGRRSGDHRTGVEGGPVLKKQEKVPISSSSRDGGNQKIQSSGSLSPSKYCSNGNGKEIERVITKATARGSSHRRGSSRSSSLNASLSLSSPRKRADNPGDTRNLPLSSVSSSRFSSFSSSFLSYTRSISTSFSSSSFSSSHPYSKYSSSSLKHSSFHSSVSSLSFDTSIPLKEGCTTPLPSRYFVDFAFRLAHPQNLLPYAELAIIYEWDLGKGEWCRTFTHVVLSVTPFSHGNMRSSYYLIDLQRPHCRLTAKRYLTDMATREQYFDDVSMHSVAGHWARLYNSCSPPKPVHFIPAAVLELLHRRPRLTLAMEPLLTGTFNKYNNNAGYLPKKVRWTPQAFSHFTYVYSQHQLMIVDIQGVNDIYTDPQILSPDGEGYGRGNLGMKGIRRFFKSHVCNPICSQLGISTSSQFGRRVGGFPFLNPSEMRCYCEGQNESTTTIGGAKTSPMSSGAAQKVQNPSQFFLQGIRYPEKNKVFFRHMKGIVRVACIKREVTSSHASAPGASQSNTSLPSDYHQHPAAQMAAIFSENLPPKASHLDTDSSLGRSKTRESFSSNSAREYSSYSSSVHSVLSHEESVLSSSSYLPPHQVTRKSIRHSSHLEPMKHANGREGTVKQTTAATSNSSNTLCQPSPPSSTPPSHRGRFPFQARRGGNYGASGACDISQQNVGSRIGALPGKSTSTPFGPSSHSLLTSSSSFFGKAGPHRTRVAEEHLERDGRRNNRLPEHKKFVASLREHVVSQAHGRASGSTGSGTSLSSSPSGHMQDPNSRCMDVGANAFFSSSVEECPTQSGNRKGTESRPWILDAQGALNHKCEAASKKSSEVRRLRALVATEKVAPSRATQKSDLVSPRKKR